MADFGSERIPIEVPASAAVVEFEDPPALREPRAELAAALAKPFGSPPFDDVVRAAGPNCTVAIGFDDPTKPAAPWQTLLPEVIGRLRSLGVSRQNIQLICANGMHKKWSADELRRFLGQELFEAFWPLGNIINHDCEDRDELLDFGETAMGGLVEHNRRFLEADLPIYVGQVVAHAWGGYTGTGAAIGLASTRSIASHHNYRVVSDPQTTTGEHRRMLFRRIKADINAALETATGRRIFYINWLGGTGGAMSHIFAGYSPEVEEPAWAAADGFSRMPVPQADVMVVGMPAAFTYGDANNPLITLAGMAYPPRIWLGRPILREGGVLIGLHPSNGEFDEATYPSYRDALECYAASYGASDLRSHQAEFAQRTDYLDRYHQGGAYHPVHPFWLLYSCDYLLSRASAVVLAGTRNPAVFRKLGVHPARDFQQAWEIATRNIGGDPVTVVAPTFWSRRPFKFEVHE